MLHTIQGNVYVSSFAVLEFATTVAAFNLGQVVVLRFSLSGESSKCFPDTILLFVMFCVVDRGICMRHVTKSERRLWDIQRQMIKK